MVTRVIQGSSEDAVKLGDKFISEGMPNSLAWGLVCSLITGTKTDATAIRTVLSQQEEDHYAALRAKRETKGSETAVAAAPAAPAPAESSQEKPVISPATDHLDAEPVAAPTTEGEGPKDPKPATPTSNSAIGNVGGQGEHL